MNPLLPPILSPLLPQIRSILLAGSDGDLVTWLLDAGGQTGPLIHVANRAFAFDVASIRARGGDRILLHPSRAADALVLMPVPDLLILDGDANWYAVSSALNAAARQARALAVAFPLTLVTDTAWPYGRRDRYTDPAAMPAAFVRPHERAGVLPGQSALAAGAGMFTDRFHARTDNEPGNGVLTAIEEFLLEQDGRLGLASLPLLHGISAIYQHAPTLPDYTRAALDAIHLGVAAREAAEATERARLEQTAEAARLRAALASAQYRIDAIHGALNREREERVRLREAEVAPQAPEPPASRVPLGLRRVVQVARSITGAQRESAQAEALASQVALDNAQIEKLRNSPILDAAWYRTRYEDIGGADIDPAEHYYRYGASEGRDPGPAFSTRFYLDHYPDVAEAGHNPVLHYLADGATERRDPGLHFSTAFYLESNPDVVRAGLNPLEHYLVSGQQENRLPRPLQD